MLKIGCISGEFGAQLVSSINDFRRKIHANVQRMVSLISCQGADSS